MPSNVHATNKYYHNPLHREVPVDQLTTYLTIENGESVKDVI